MNTKEGEYWLRSPYKRAMDLGVVALFGMPAGALATVGAAALAVEMKRKPWFTQTRVGQSPEQLIAIPKLVTLRGPIDAVHSNGYDHQRASTAGRVIRKLHIDEAPQLLLVLKGDMSAVGARPAVIEEHEHIMDVLSPVEQQAYLHARAICKPGIVTMDSAEQHGHTATNAYQKAMNIIEYANTASFKLDMQLLTRSGRAVAGEVGL